MVKKQQNVGRFFGGNDGRSKVVPSNYVHNSRSHDKAMVSMYIESYGLLGAIRQELDASVKTGVSLIVDTGYVNPYSTYKIIFLQWCERWLTT